MMVRKATATATKEKKVKLGAGEIVTLVSNNMMMVPSHQLKHYPKNPRKGAVEEIKKTIKKNGWAKILLVQKSTMYVLAGNQSWIAGKELGMVEFPCSLLDVDDDTAARIVLADNRLNDLSNYDNELLADIMKGLDGPEGTGYDQETYDALIDAVANSITDMPQRSDEAFDALDVPEGLGDFDAPNMAGLDDDDEDDEPEGDLEVAEETMRGAFTLKSPDDVEYEMVGELHIPPLRPDMLATPDLISPNLKAWAGSATKDWPDPDQQWLYNVGVDSTSGMRDVSKCIISFFTWDHYFENWWVYPDRWCMKLLNSNVRLALTPDWSMWASKPKVLALWSLYRQRWVGRYMQEAGIKVIPNIAWYGTDKKFFDKYIRATLPGELPVVAFQLQTVDDLEDGSKELKELEQMVEYVIKACDADLTLVYVGKRGRALMERIDLSGHKVQLVDFRQAALAEQAKGRTKKKGL